MTTPCSRVTVIILNWNGKPYLEGCLSSVMARTYPDFEVVLVDNGSTDGSAEFVARRFPQVRIIRHDENLGFAAGNNTAIRATRSLTSEVELQKSPRGRGSEHFPRKLQCKSDIKFLNYSAMGAAGVYSRVPAYESSLGRQCLHLQNSD